MTTFPKFGTLEKSTNECCIKISQKNQYMSIELEPDKFYHIYNRANGNEKLFVSNENYRFFLRRYKDLISPIADTFAYCLMPNHFHFLVRIKAEKELRTFPKFMTLKNLFLSKSFSNLFSSYSQAYNKEQGRQGSLFMKNFKRKPILDEVYLRKVIHYIHFNPVHHHYREDIEVWEFCSYSAIISSKPTILRREEVIDLFDDLENFIYCHKNPPELTGIE